MKLVQSEVPDVRRPEPKYLRYMPLVEEFVSKGMPSGMVVAEEGEEPVSQGNLKTAVAKLGASGVAVRTRMGNVYLVRIND